MDCGAEDNGRNTDYVVTHLEGQDQRPLRESDGMDS